jgi:DNA polymerase-3 subunit gamma/tau
MSYEVTANRRRPGSFDALTGQEFVVTTIKKSIEANKIAHAYLFSGSRGVGKTSAARILAKSLNCQNGPTPNPCGVCSNCVEIAKGSSLDVIEIDGASNTSVNDVREIKDEVLFAPNTSKYKVYIIDEVHMLSNSAFNALLKTIEEPPPYVVFIFATTEIHKVPATIKSRCQQFNFRLIDVEDIKERLAEACAEMGIKVDQDALFWMAKEGNGSLRDAYTLFDQIVAFSDSHITLEKIREKLGLVGLEQMNQLIETLAGGKSEEALEVLDKIVAQGVSIDQFIIDLAEYFPLPTLHQT